MKIEAGSLRWKAVVLAAMLCAVLALQAYQGAYRTNLGGHPDEAAHFVTGVAAFDYLTQRLGMDPVAFAGAYYVHYPKVAFGHWPPGFYGIQALWYVIFGPEIASGMLLMGMVVALAAWILFLWVWPRHGVVIAALSSGVFLALPLVRENLSYFLADMLAVLFTMLGLVALIEALETGSRQRWLAFIGWSVCAGLTKQSALTLLILGPVVWLAGAVGRRQAQRAGMVAASLLVVVSAIVLAYWTSGVFELRYVTTAARLQTIRDNFSFAVECAKAASPVLFLIAALGSVGVNQVNVRVALAFLAIVLAGQIGFRDMVEGRYYLPAFVPLTILFAEGLARIRKRSVWLAAGAAALAVATMPATHTAQRIGYAEVASAVPYGVAGPVILISSDAVGEGAFIAERLTHDEKRGGVVLRGSKVLSSGDWMGRKQRLLAQSKEEVLQVLDKFGVRYVVLDEHGFIDAPLRAHHRLLTATIEGNASQFRLVQTLPLTWRGVRRPEAIRVYENLLGATAPPRRIQLDMSHTLNRMLEAETTPMVAGPTRSLHLIRGFPLPGGSGPAPTPSFQIEPQEDSIAADGGMGWIYVTSPEGQGWQASASEEWIHVTEGRGQVGPGTIRYTLDANGSNQARSGRIQIGEAVYAITQLPPTTVHLPYEELFATRPHRWILENANGTATLELDAEGPGGASSLRLTKREADKEWFDTQAFVAAIEMESGIHRVSFWLRSREDGKVRVVYGQRTAPYRTCGLVEDVRVTPEWRKYEFRFQPDTTACDSGNNRLSFAAGEAGKQLWIGRLSLSVE